MQKIRRFGILCLAVIVVMVSGVRFIQLNQKWAQPQITIVPKGEILKNEGIQWQIEDSVLGSVRETLQYYGCKNEDVAESDILDMKDYGWNGYVMAVKWKITNNTTESVNLEQVILADAESSQWANTYNFIAVEFYCQNEKNIPAGESREYIYPYEIYQQHFRNCDWKNIGKRSFYLTREPYYPQKIMFECTPKFLKSTQQE